MRIIDHGLNLLFTRFIPKRGFPLNRIYSSLVVFLCVSGLAFGDQPESASVVTSSSSLILSSAAVDSVATSRGPGDLGNAIQAKMDSISAALASDGSNGVNSDSLAKVKADSVRAAIAAGNYIPRANYDKNNFDHWKVDTVYQKKMKASVAGSWRTPILPHGHAFRDAELVFGMNDTIAGVTRTYSDSGRYQMTGEYSYRAKYRFDNDSTIITREVFKERGVVRWDYIRFKVDGKKFKYHLIKLEFRDLNDNWLNALQGFDNVEPEYYFREAEKSAEPQSVLKYNGK